MEIAWIRIYQDKNGSGLNPKITPEDEQQIFSSKSGAIPYSGASNIGDKNRFSSNEERDTYYGNATTAGCEYLASKKDNFCSPCLITSESFRVLQSVALRGRFLK